MRKPECYKCPIRKRADIIAWIFDATKQRSYDYRPYPFCFNVKAYGVDFDYDNLLRIHREANNDPVYTHNDEWLAATIEKYEEVKDNLWDWAIEDARSHFVSYRKDGKVGSDAYSTLWDGTSVDVTYSFEGRSGGWLSINKFEGHDFTNRDDDAGECLQGMEYKTLRKLYQLVTMLKHSLSRSKIREELAYQAAWALFVNVCNDIPKPDAIQPTLFSSTS